MPRNPYESYSKKELLEIEKRKKEFEAKRLLAINVASEIVNDEKYASLKGRVEEFRSAVFEKINEPMGVSPIEDAYYLRACINTLNVLNTILGMPVEDLKKG